MSSDWRSVLSAGMAPPALLRARVVDAEEVLVLSYTADLRFFERVALPEARAAGARVTVVHDIAANLVGAERVRHAGIHYTDVPVRCRSGGEFHPKLLVAAGPDRALVAIGSGNATASGWHHNGELWTTLAADPSDWPDTFQHLAAWLDRLSGVLHVDAFGAERIAAVAIALRRHRAVTTGPRLIHNLDTPVIDQLPTPSGIVTELTIASPFLDDRCRALDRLTTHLKPDQTILALTCNADADAKAVARWATRTGAAVRPIHDQRYFHGKLVQWNELDKRTVLTGSANITAAALLRTTRETNGNCELALLCATTDDLTPSLGEVLDGARAIAGQLTPAPPPPPRDEATPRLLRALIEAGGVAVTVLVADPSLVEGAVIVADSGSYALTLSSSHGRTHELRADAALLSGALCHVEVRNGTRTGTVRVTDPDAVVARPGHGSPLDDARLGRVLSNPRLSARLFDALAELAAIRPDTPPGQGRAGRRALSWRQSAERAVGSALVTLALGPAHPHEVGSADDDDMPTDVDAGDVVSETDEDDDATSLFDDTDTDAGVRDPFNPESDPVSLLTADPVSAHRLAKAIDRRCEDLNGWSTVARLALLRVTMIVAAGGGWHNDDDTAWTVSTVLTRVADALDDDDDVRASQDAATLVALALLRTQIDDWDSAQDWLVEDFEYSRGASSIDPSHIDEVRVAHFAADLELRYGTPLTVNGILDAGEYLIGTSLLEKEAEALEEDFPGLRLAARRLLQVHVGRAAFATAMRLLDRVSSHAPVAVKLTGRDEEVYAAWRPKELTLQRTTLSGIPQQGGIYQLAIGPGAHREGHLPTPQRKWATIPADVEDELVSEGLLEGPDT